MMNGDGGGGGGGGGGGDDDGGGIKAMSSAAGATEKLKKSSGNSSSGASIREVKWARARSSQVGNEVVPFVRLGCLANRTVQINDEF